MSDVAQTLIDEILSYEWDDEDAVVNAIIPNIHFTLSDKESPEAVLNSKFGGRPATPKNFDWPMQSHKPDSPYAFFFQLNFEEIKKYDAHEEFPEKGLLACFASVTDDALFDPGPDRVKIFFFPETDGPELFETPQALPREQILSPRIINFTKGYQLPRDLFIPQDLSDDDRDGVEDISYTLETETQTVRDRITGWAKRDVIWQPENDLYTLYSYNQISGVPRSIQALVSEEWANEYFPERDPVGEEYLGYVNLISFEMNKNEGQGFSTNGAHLFLCMSKEELRRGDFSKVLPLVQNT